MIDRGFFLARPDLVATGRTLVGARPPKGQELEDHYFATMNQRIVRIPSCTYKINTHKYSTNKTISSIK
jgi:glutamine synthetase